MSGWAWAGLAALLAYLAASVVALVLLPARSRPAALAAFRQGRSVNLVLLVIAHPDDEAMFFAPTVLSLRAAGSAVHVLSLSTGNADGLGAVRSVELVAAGAALGLSPANCVALDDQQLPDGFGRPWAASVVAGAIRAHVATLPALPCAVITFDAGGVSGHPNHRDAAAGVALYIAQAAAECSSGGAPAPLGWQLVTTSLGRKFAGVLDILPSWLASRGSDRQRKGLVHRAATACFVTPSWPTAVAAMQAHASQFVWYRRLFVLLARYTYVNTLQPLR